MDAHAQLTGFEVLQTRDVETARRTLMRTFGASRFEPVDDADGFEARASLASLGDVAICYCYYATPVRLSFPEASAVRQLICLSGEGRFIAGQRRGELDAQNWSAVIPSGVPVDFEHAADYRQLVVWIDGGRLERTLAALRGVSCDGAVARYQANPNTPGMRALRRAVEFAVAELEIAGKDSSPVALAEMQDLIITRFLHGHCPELADPAAREAASPSRPQMRHLEDYLRGHWSEPVTVERLAEIANVGARSIFRYFRQVHGSTPLDFIKTLRLQEARRGLQNPHEATSVSSEALRCGFNNMGHFAKDYRRKFGELPSITLTAARARSGHAVAASSVDLAFAPHLPRPRQANAKS